MNGRNYMTPGEAARVIGLHGDDLTSFSKDDIKRAFREKASAMHPDHGGDSDAMRELLEARDMLLRIAARRDSTPVRTRRQTLESAEALEMQEFSRKIEVDLASCYLALPRIKKHGLDLDSPRAEKLARGEANRFKRGNWHAGAELPPRDGRGGAITEETRGFNDRWMRVDESQIAARFRDAPATPKKWAGGMIDLADAGGIADDKEGKEDREAQIQALLRLKAALKPRDREILEMLFEDELTVKEIAEKLGKSVSAIYEALKRMRKQGLLADEKARREWAEEHNGLRLGTGDDAPIPIVLLKNGQVAWELGVAI